MIIVSVILYSLMVVAPRTNVLISLPVVSGHSELLQVIRIDRIVDNLAKSRIIIYRVIDTSTITHTHTKQCNFNEQMKEITRKSHHPHQIVNAVNDK